MVMIILMFYMFICVITITLNEISIIRLKKKFAKWQKEQEEVLLKEWRK